MQRFVFFAVVAVLFTTVVATHLEDDLEMDSELMGMQSLLEDAVKCNTGPRIAEGSVEEDLALALFQHPGCSLHSHFNHDHDEFKRFLHSHRVGREGRDFDPSKAFECHELLKEVLGSKEAGSTGDAKQDLKKSESAWSRALRYKGFNGEEDPAAEDAHEFGVDTVGCTSQHAQYKPETDSCECSGGDDGDDQDSSSSSCGRKVHVPTPEDQCNEAQDQAESFGDEHLHQAARHLHSCWKSFHSMQASSGVDSFNDGSVTHIVTRHHEESSSSSSSASDSFDYSSSSNGGDSSFNSTSSSNSTSADGSEEEHHYGLNDKEKEIASRLHELHVCFEEAKRMIRGGESDESDESDESSEHSDDEDSDDEHQQDSFSATHFVFSAPPPRHRRHHSHRSHRVASPPQNHRNFRYAPKPRSFAVLKQATEKWQSRGAHCTKENPEECDLEDGEDEDNEDGEDNEDMEENDFEGDEE